MAILVAVVGLGLLIAAHVEDAMLCGHDWGQLRQNELADGQHVLLALKHASELGEVRLEPVLFIILDRGVLQVPNHLVDVVLQGGDFAAGIDLDESGQVAFGNCSRDVGNRSHLGSQICREPIDVVCEIFPGAGRPRNTRLTAEFAFDTYFAGNCGDLIGESCQCLDHAVNGISKFRNFTLSLDQQLPFQISVGYSGDHLRNTADLVRQVGRHEVHIISEIFPGA